MYPAALEDPNATPGELVVHMVAQAGGDAGEAKQGVRAFVEYMAEPIGRSARVEVVGFPAARDRVRDDAEFSHLLRAAMRWQRIRITKLEAVA